MRRFPSTTNGVGTASGGALIEQPCDLCGEKTTEIMRVRIENRAQVEATGMPLGTILQRPVCTRCARGAEREVQELQAQRKRLETFGTAPAHVDAIMRRRTDDVLQRRMRGEPPSDEPLVPGGARVIRLGDG